MRVDPQDNIWTVDEGGSTIVKFNPQGQVLMVLGRTPEYLPMPGFDRVNSAPPPVPTGPVGVGRQGDEFDRPTDVAWDAQGNIFVTDGHVNSRVAKFDSNGRFLKSWGSRGTGAGAVQHSAFARDRRAGECLRRAIATTVASRSSTTTARSRPNSATSALRGRSA